METKGGGYLPFYKRTFVVDRPYQLGFVVRLLAIVLAGAAVFMATFYLLSQGTMSVSYEHYDLRLGRASSMLMPQVLTATAIYCVLTGLTVALITIVTSHRMAGPIYRMVRTVTRMQGGDLTPRIRLRKKDSSGELAEALNRLFEGYTEQIRAASADAHSVLEHAALLKQRGAPGPDDLIDLESKVRGLTERLAYFRTEAESPAGGAETP